MSPPRCSGRYLRSPASTGLTAKAGFEARGNFAPRRPGGGVRAGLVAQCIERRKRPRGPMRSTIRAWASQARVPMVTPRPSWSKRPANTPWRSRVCWSAGKVSQAPGELHDLHRASAPVRGESGEAVGGAGTRGEEPGVVAQRLRPGGQAFDHVAGGIAGHGQQHRRDGIAIAAAQARHLGGQMRLVLGTRGGEMGHEAVRQHVQELVQRAGAAAGGGVHHLGIAARQHAHGAHQAHHRGDHVGRGRYGPSDGSTGCRPAAAPGWPPSGTA